MNTQTKNLLTRSINQFKAASADERTKMLSHVLKSIKDHEKHVNSIGAGYADHYVTAGRIFYRIFKPRTVCSGTIDGYKFQAVKYYTGDNYNISLHVKDKGGLFLRGTSQPVDILAEVVRIINRRPVSIPGLEKKAILI